MKKVQTGLHTYLYTFNRNEWQKYVDMQKYEQKKFNSDIEQVFINNKLAFEAHRPRIVIDWGD